MKNYDVLKGYCKIIYLIGSGNFWYEEKEIGDDRRFLYRALSALLYFIYAFLTVLEIMAAVMGEFPEDEKRDSMSFAVSHTIVMIKIYSVVTHKSLIKTLSHKMITVCQSYENQELMAEKYKIMKINVIGYAGFVYASCVCFIFEGLRKVYTGSNFITAVTYYPSFGDDSRKAIFVRILNTVILNLMMGTMIISVDFFTMVYIIMYKYKFVTLRQYFEHLKDEVERLHSTGQNDLIPEKLANGLVEGIAMHSNVVKLSTDIDKAFGTVMALQLCQSSGSAVTILLQMALTDDLKMVAAAKLVTFVIGLFFLLGLFLCNAGEITHQASLVSDAIFYCGWQLCPPRSNNKHHRNIRPLMVLAIMQAQRPLVMKAFKMIELTYGTFLLVVRSTYSVFALFYAQNK